MDYDPTTATPLRHDPAAAATREFWLDDLQVAHFPNLLKVLQSPAELEKTFAEHWTGPVNERAAQEVFEAHGDSPEVRLNLVFLAVFIKEKQQEAILDVARNVLPAEVLSAHEAFQGRCCRRAAAVQLYLADPARLLDVFLLDMWHPRRRCALRLKGHRRDLPNRVPIEELPWEGMIVNGVPSHRFLPVFPTIGYRLIERSDEPPFPYFRDSGMRVARVKDKLHAGPSASLTRSTRIENALESGRKGGL
jgi:hypothetical protein